MIFLNSSWPYYQQQQMIEVCALAILVCLTVFVEAVIFNYVVKRWKVTGIENWILLTAFGNLISFVFGLAFTLVF